MKRRYYLERITVGWNVHDPNGDLVAFVTDTKCIWKHEAQRVVDALNLFAKHERSLARRSKVGKRGGA